MRRQAFVVALLVFAWLSSPGQADSADTIIVNVAGYSWHDGGLQTFAALRFDPEGRIVAVYEQSAGLDSADALRIDCGGATLIPGLIDAHGHVLGLGRLRSQVDLSGARTRAEALQRVAAFARNNPDLPWILGHGWNQELWENNSFPLASDLDSLRLSRPVWVSRVDGHAGWANSKAMQLAGISRRTRDPDGGRILRDRDGAPTGVFVDKAKALITQIIPDPSPEQDQAALLAALEELASLGLTSVHDAGIDLRISAIYTRLNDTSRLPIRVYAMLAEDAWRHFGPPLTDDGTGFLAIQSVKTFLDGALGSRGAAMLAPYSDQPSNRGLLFKTTRQLTRLARKVDRRGFQLNVHAIGDAANHVALDALSRLRTPAPLRHRIEHAQVIQTADLPRFAEYGIIASIQPTHATSDKNMAESRVGPERILGAYAWRRLIDSGARLAGGSDFPVEAASPLYGIHAAVTRQDRQNQPADGWYSDQRLGVDEALRLFTLDAAYAARQEKHLGSLEPGKRADFVLLDRNIFEIPPEQIWRTKVRETWVNGTRVYRAENAAL